MSYQQMILTEFSYENIDLRPQIVYLPFTILTSVVA